MNRLLLVSLLTLTIAAFHSCSPLSEQHDGAAMPLLHVDGEHVLTAAGDTFYIQGVNLGFWLNPEGYMFALPQACSAPRTINDLFCQMVGPDEAADFWEAYKDCFITEADIRFIATTGANTVRLPFHYALLTDEDFLGRTSAEGFARLDTAIAWCRRAGLYVVLDMHDCPGGQTGDNIDDSYGYPDLFLSARSQERFCSLWRDIARRYRNENTVLGYELMNEPIAHYFEADLDTLNSLLEPLYVRCLDSIRRVDDRHIVLLGGAQWNGNFRPFRGLVQDDNILYACHRYGHGSDEEGIRDFIQFRDSVGIAMCMTETGHRPHEWLRAEAQTLRRNNIGLLWWPYKKLGGSCWMHAGIPDGWEAVQQFAAADRSTFAAIRDHRPDRVASRHALSAFLDSVRYDHCHPDTIYSRLFLE